MAEIEKIKQVKELKQQIKEAQEKINERKLEVARLQHKGTKLVNLFKY